MIFPAKPLTESRLLRRREWFDIGDIVQTPMGKEAEVIGKRDGRMVLRYVGDSDRNAPLVQPHLLKRLRRAGEC